MVRRSGSLHLLVEVAGQLDLGPARQGGPPADQLPLARAKHVLAAGHNRAIDPDLRAHQVLPSGPGGVPGDGEQDRIEQDFELAPAVAVERVVGQEVQPAQVRAEAPPARFRQERDDALREKRLPVSGQFAAHHQRPEASVREHGRRIRIVEQSVIAGTEVRLHQHVERTLQIAQLAARRPGSLQLQAPELERQPQFSGARAALHPERVVERRRLRPRAATVAPVEVVADRARGQVHPTYPQPAGNDLSPEETCLAWIGLGLRDVADLSLVQLFRPDARRRARCAVPFGFLLRTNR